MKRVFPLLVAIVLAAPPASAAILFESGTLGPTGVTWNDLVIEAAQATNIKNTVFTGVKFQLQQPVATSEIGGHFVALNSGTFFGAIVELDNENDFPNSADLSTPDVLGTTLLTFPVNSKEVYGDLSLSLDPGWYALVFGSGLFGATTNGAALRNGTDIGNPTYIALQPLAGFGWGNLSSFFDNHRFVINGSIVPEPSSLVITYVVSLLLLFRARLYL